MEITFKDVDHIYQKGTPFERKAIFDINLQVQSGTFLAVIGHTGSGKSTLMQHINALLKPTSGTVQIGKYNIHSKKKSKDLKSLRKRVGIVFQYPEHQLFEETVEKDICFAPLNFGVNEKTAKKRAREAISKVGLSETLLQKSPFELSGGQKRRVAIAGVLVMNPEVIILDEPTAGLDPRGRKEIMGMFHRLHKETGLTTILVTHSMEDAAQYADEIVVMDKGTTLLRGQPSDIFKNTEMLQSIGLDIPESIQFIRKLEKQFGISIKDNIHSVQDVAKVINQLLSRGEKL